MIDPGFWRDEKLAGCSYMERLLFIGLWTFAEDNGVGRASPLLIKADVFPYETLREADIKKSLVKLAGLGLIRLYEVDSQMYYHVTNFRKHQTINKPSQCYLPKPPSVQRNPVSPGNTGDVNADCMDIQVVLPEDSGSTTTPLPSQEKLSKEKRNNIYLEIIKFLNEKAGTSYRSGSQKTQRLIDARLNEGFSLEDFKRVIVVKCDEWNHEPVDGGKDMRKYLRPETLFGTKFEGYLNQTPLCPLHDPQEQLPPPEWLNKENPTMEEILGVDFGE